MPRASSAGPKRPDIRKRRGSKVGNQVAEVIPSSPVPSAPVAPHPNDSSHSSAPAPAAELLVNAPPTKKWRDWSVRWFYGLVFVVVFITLLLSTRQLGILLFVVAVQCAIYRELVNIAINYGKENQMPGFKYLYYYWYGVAAFAVYSHMLEPLRSPLREDRPGTLPVGLRHALSNVLTHRVLIASALYFLGLITFVLSLRRQKHFKYQFGQWGFCHIAILGVLLPSSALLSTVSSGLIFFFLPISLVVCNDSFAYITGFAIGRTPLIALSPKKTVEGFVGGFIATLIWGLILPLLLAPYLTSLFTSMDIRSVILCPVPVEEWWSLPTNKCNIDALAHGIYVWKPLAQSALGAYLPAALQDIQYCDLQVHAMVMGVFASLVAPFGGFFASGLKRALKIKDFGTTIPGHGGFTDRMDCQLVMGFFAYIYLHYVIGIGSSAAPFLFRKAVFMSDADIAALQRMLTCFLGTEGHSANPYDTFLQCRDMNIDDSIPT